MLSLDLLGCSIRGNLLAKLCVFVLMVCQWLAPETHAAAPNQSELADSCVQTRPQMISQNLLPHIAHFWDADGEIQAPDKTAGYQLTQAASGYPFKRFEYSGDMAPLTHTQSNHWLRFCLTNPTNVTLNFVAAFAPPSLSEIDFYPQKPGLQSFKTGNAKVMNTRDIPNIHYDFNIRLIPGETQTFYLRVNAVDNPYISANLLSRRSYDHQKNIDEARWGIYVGVFVGLVIYHLLLFFSARQTTSLLFIFWATSVFILLSSLNARLVQYFFPNHPHLTQLGVDIFYPLSTLMSAVLFSSFIQLKRYPKLNHVANGLLGFGALALLLAYTHNSIAYAKTLDAVAVLTACFFGLWAPIYAIIKDHLNVAKYVMVTLVPMIVVLVDRALFSLEITNEYFIPYDLRFAVVCAMIIISYYIGIVAYQDKQAAQRNALEQLNISNNLKSTYNTQLEEELEKKTADIRSMNVDLEQQAIKLLQLDESKSKFFANISHEFRTPLTLIEGPLTGLLEHEGDDEKIVTNKSTIDGLLKHSRSLKGLIDEILLLSELDENALDLKASRVNVVETVRALTAQFESVYHQQGVDLVYQAQDLNIQAYVDVEKLQVILNNLLSNAIKFTESAGRVSVEVSSTAQTLEPTDGYTTDEYVEIVVADTGHGIPEHELEHVFDRYFQSNSSELSKSGIGTGIGLALVKELVELHAGNVSVESVHQTEKGEGSEGSLHADGSLQSGTRFRINLPLGRAHLSDNEIIDELVIDSAGYERLSPVTDLQPDFNPTKPSQPLDNERPIVLVVDDNADMRQHIAQVLDTKYNIITAADGILAEAALNKQLPALIITDLMMPNRNGLEFVQSIKKQPQFANIPIIMLTARAGLHDRIEGLMAAVDDYLIKPFNGRELKARIENLLNKQAQFNAFYQARQASIGGREQTPNNAEKTPDTRNSPDTFLNKVKAVVENRLMQSNFGVDELAQALHVSEATLRRRLAEYGNFTPAAFIRHCRMEQARQLIAAGQVRKLSEAAHSVGFTNPDYFARLYRKTFNSEIELSSLSD